MKFTWHTSYMIAIKIIKKMPCGRSVTIPRFGTFKAYYCKKSKGRRFAFVGSHMPNYFPACGNLTLYRVEDYLGWFYSKYFC